MVPMADYPEAVVVDVGSASARFGFAGESSPCALPSAVGKLLAEGDAAAQAVFGASELSTHREGLQVLPTVFRGAVSDWDSLGQLWRHGAELLKCDFSERPVLLAESAQTDQVSAGTLACGPRCVPAAA